MVPFFVTAHSTLAIPSNKLWFSLKIMDQLKVISANGTKPNQKKKPFIATYIDFFSVSILKALVISFHEKRQKPDM